VTKVVCETCGEEIWSAEGPCWSCDEPRPVTDWKAFSQRGFRFEFAMKAMRLGKSVRRLGWERHVVIEDRGNGVPILSLKPSQWDGIDPYHPCSDDVLATDWEVVS